MTATLDVALTALRAHSTAMQVTSHNLANAATPGYSRQRASLNTMVPQQTTIGQLGRGVQVIGIERVADELVSGRLRDAAIDLGRYQRLDQILTDIELVFAEPGESGLSAAFDNLFADAEQLIAGVDSGAERAGFVQALQVFTGRLNNLSDQLGDQALGLVAGARAEVSTVNGLLSRIASINQQVSRDAIAGRNPNDLTDERDRLLAELASYMDIRVRPSTIEGAVTVDVGGAVLVSSVGSSQLEVITGSTDELQYVFAGTGEQVVVSSGNLGALAEVSSETLPGLVAHLDELTGILVREINRIHSVGTGPSAGSAVFISDQVFGPDHVGLNLDSGDLVREDGRLDGIPAVMLPTFTDEAGVSQVSNLSLNVFDEISGVAEKFIVRYDPGTAAIAASRSVEDLVAAINTGRGGGFSIEPRHAGGAGPVTASLVPVSGGVRLQLAVADGKRIDFSRALDTRPSDAAWSGDAVTISGADLA
ncbi:MAG: flagellar hook-associated protein FlgK, partial [Planctomycetota bacterium]